MDQYSHYLMLMNSKRHQLEQAFAEDANGPLGGFMWPPRNYSCTFCKREFRSAQALGGHMNVHRRDRAMLKQSPSLSPQHHEDSTSPDHHIICNGPSKFVASPPRESSFVSKQNTVPFYSSSHIISSKAQENEYMSNYVACKKSNMRKEDQSTFGSGLVDGYVETSLSVGLYFGVSSRTRPAGDDIGGELKRRKTEDVFALPFLFKGCLNDKDTKIDLELRLGDSPVVNESVI